MCRFEIYQNSNCLVYIFENFVLVFEGRVSAFVRLLVLLEKASIYNALHLFVDFTTEARCTCSISNYGQENCDELG